MKGKRNESLRLFNNGKDVKMEKENKGVSHTSFEVQRKKNEQSALQSVLKVQLHYN